MNVAALQCHCWKVSLKEYGSHSIRSWLADKIERCYMGDFF